MGKQAYLAYGIPQNRLKRLNLLQKVSTLDQFTMMKKDTSLFANLCRGEFASPDFDFAAWGTLSNFMISLKVTDCWECNVGSV